MTRARGLRRRGGVLPALLLLGAACRGGISPLRHFAEAGRDEYAVFVADAPGGSDLFAVRGVGGPVTQLTFSPVPESAPALSPDGVVLAFLRPAGLADSAPRSIWVMNLLNGAEREVPLPRGVAPEAVGWSRDGAALYARSADGRLWVLEAPPAPPDPRPAAGAARAAAESSLAVVVGDPPFAMVAPCDSAPTALCASRGGRAEVLAGPARGAARWGPDSVGYFVGERFLVRPLGPGRERELDWRDPPANPRSLVFFPGGS